MFANDNISVTVGILIVRPPKIEHKLKKFYLSSVYANSLIAEYSLTPVILYNTNINNAY